MPSHFVDQQSSTLSLDTQEAALQLVVDAGTPIFTLALACTLPLVLLEVPADSAIVSRGDPDLANGNATLATYRC